MPPRTPVQPEPSTAKRSGARRFDVKTARHEARDMEGMVRRVARGMVRRAEAGEHDALVALVAMRDAIDEATVLSARALHDAEIMSWTDIGRELGISRQAARKRFARPTEPVPQQHTA